VCSVGRVGLDLLDLYAEYPDDAGGGHVEHNGVHRLERELRVKYEMNDTFVGCHRIDGTVRLEFIAIDVHPNQLAAIIGLKHEIESEFHEVVLIERGVDENADNISVSSVRWITVEVLIKPNISGFGVKHMNANNN